MRRIDLREVFTPSELSKAGAKAIIGLALVLAAVLTANCASRQSPALPPSTPATAISHEPIVDPAALIRHGCFSCLGRALAAARQQQDAGLVFEAAVLLAARARELGMPADEWIEEARTLAVGDSGRLVVLDILESLPRDRLSGARDHTLAQTPRRQRVDTLTPSWLDALARGSESPEFRSYLRLSLTCSSATTEAMSPAEVVDSIPADVRTAPLLRYRLGICGPDHVETLRALRVADQDFVDADFALARYAVQRRPYPDFDDALERLQAAAVAFPRSSAIAATAGDVNQLVERWPEALGAYDAAIALVADHPDALIGRTIALSNLGRHEEAIATATSLIEGGRWFIGQALYWRAWNRFQLTDYTVARQDADRAKMLMVNAGVYLLSGMIEWRLRRLEGAEREFEEALRMDFGQCEAATFLGGVRNERSRVPEAVAAFTQAVRCYDLTIGLAREAIGLLEKSDAPPSHRARQLARHERTIAQAEKRRAEAANGAALLQQYLTSTQSPPPPPRP
jgi:tetratricopeptide (TPR) repeat protein